MGRSSATSAAAYLATRHQLTDDLAARIPGINVITDAAVAP